MFQLRIGCDPEFFVANDKGELISAHGLVPGTKENPLVVANAEGGTVQVDGLALEVGIEPALNANEFQYRVTQVLARTKALVPPRYKFVLSPSVYFNKEYYDTKVPAEAKVLGCTPDRDAYKMGDFNPIPPIVETPKGVMRTGAGHLHLGWTNGADVEDKDHILDCVQLVQNLDKVFNTYVPYWDDDEDRRKMYGKPGAFRVKPYGVEYRTLSNAWLRSTYLQRDVFNLAQYAFYATVYGKDDLLGIIANAGKLDAYTEQALIGKTAFYGIKNVATTYNALPQVINNLRYAKSNRMYDVTL